MMDVSEKRFSVRTRAQRAQIIRLILATLLLFCITNVLTALLFLGLPDVTSKSGQSTHMQTSIQAFPPAKRVWSDS